MESTRSPPLAETLKMRTLPRATTKRPRQGSPSWNRISPRPYFFALTRGHLFFVQAGKQGRLAPYGVESFAHDAFFAFRSQWTICSGNHVFDAWDIAFFHEFIEDLSFCTVRQRLIALILRLAQASAARSSEGVQVELSKSQQDLAAELGTVRELISRNLGRLQAEGYLVVDGRSIIVKDAEGLKREQEFGD